MSINADNQELHDIASDLCHLLDVRWKRRHGESPPEGTHDFMETTPKEGLLRCKDAKGTVVSVSSIQVGPKGDIFLRGVFPRV